MGCRRAFALLRGLPHDSATWRGEEHWTWREELAALQIELIDSWARAFARIKGAKPRGSAIQIPRPGAAVPEAKRTPATGAEIAGFFSKWFSTG